MLPIESIGPLKVQNQHLNIFRGVDANVSKPANSITFYEGLTLNTEYYSGEAAVGNSVCDPYE